MQTCLVTFWEHMYGQGWKSFLGIRDVWLESDTSFCSWVVENSKITLPPGFKNQEMHYHTFTTSWISYKMGTPWNNLVQSLRKKQILVGSILFDGLNNCWIETQHTNGIWLLLSNAFLLFPGEEDTTSNCPYYWCICPNYSCPPTSKTNNTCILWYNDFLLFQVGMI